MSHFKSINRNTDFLLPPSVDEWLPESHLARYIVAVVDQLDLSALERAYAGRGSRAYHPAMLLALLMYGYATGTFSSRKLERATYDSLAFRFIAGNQHPDHDTLATFRRRFIQEFSEAFVQVLQIARENQFSQFGKVSLDGTKLHANASRHKALSYAHAVESEKRLKQEVAELVALAEQADQTPVPDGMDIPEEIKRREVLIARIAAAKKTIEARAEERLRREQAEYDDNVAKRTAYTEKTGKKVRGKPPSPPEGGIGSKDQVNLTDDESRIMPESGGGFEQSYNAQIAVDTDSLLVLALDVTQATNDKQQMEPMLKKLAELPATLNAVTMVIADAGYFSAHNVQVCVDANIEPLIAPKREPHHPPPTERYTDPAPLHEHATPVEAMRHTLKTRSGRADYALRKQTVEPVFGIIKSVMGFRQFLTRGLDNVRNEWTLVCLAWNLKRMAKLRPMKPVLG